MKVEENNIQTFCGKDLFKWESWDELDAGTLQFSGTVKETYTDHIIVDIPDISDHCWFENGFNIGDVQPVYDFCSGELENNYE